MLSQNYQNIYNLIKDEISFDVSTLHKCLHFVENLTIDSYVYSERLIEDFNLQENEALEFLAILTREKILKKAYKIYCPHCGSFDPETYYNIADIINVEVCEKCGRTLNIEQNPLKYLAIFFKKNGQ